MSDSLSCSLSLLQPSAIHPILPFLSEGDGVRLLVMALEN